MEELAERADLLAEARLVARAPTRGRLRDDEARHGLRPAYVGKARIAQTQRERPQPRLARRQRDLCGPAGEMCAVERAAALTYSLGGSRDDPRQKGRIGPA